MSIAKSTLFNGMGGSLGNVIVYEVNGKIRMRSKPLGYKKSESAGQQSQKNKFRSAALFFRHIGIPMRLAWKEAVRGTDLSGYNLFIKENIHRFTPEGLVDDISKIKICHGPLYIPDRIEMHYTAPNTVSLTWTPYCPDNCNSNGNDLLQLAIYDENKKRNYKVYGLEHAPVKRKEGSCTLQLPAEIKGEIHLFVFFRKPYENIYSDSRFAGTVRME